MKRYVAGGWDEYRKACIPHDAAPAVVEECRLSFFAGAGILNATIMRALSAGHDVTDGDVRVMQDIGQELAEFGVELDRVKLAQFLRRPK